MVTVEDLRYSRDYLDPDKRSIANALQVHFKDGFASEQIVVEYPIGHRRRRAEGIPAAQGKVRQESGIAFSGKTGRSDYRTL